MAPTTNWPIDAPTLPEPSIIPQTVLTAFECFPLPLPMSAEHVAAIVFVTPYIKKP